MEPDQYQPSNRISSKIGRFVADKMDRPEPPDNLILIVCGWVITTLSLLILIMLFGVFCILAPIVAVAMVVLFAVVFVVSLVVSLLIHLVMTPCRWLGLYKNRKSTIAQIPADDSAKQ